MSGPPLRLRIALWAAIGLQVALLLVRLALEVRLVGSAASPEGGLTTVFVDTLTMAVFPAVGLVILRRWPNHPVGWLFCFANAGWIINTTVRSYVRLGVVAEPGSLPSPETVAWLYTWPGFVSSAFYVLLILLFPDGRYPSRRWRLLGRTTVGCMTVAGSLAAVAPGPLDASFGVEIDNPLGVTDATLGPLLSAASTWGYPVAVLLLAAVAAFRPLRTRVQANVDRPFHRALYHAQRSVEVFGQRLRDDVDLMALTADLRLAVTSTVQPAAVELWLRTEVRP